MYALVYFPADKTSSVVYEKLIQWPQQQNGSDRGNVDKRPNINNIVEVLWGDKVIIGKILYKSSKYKSNFMINFFEVNFFVIIIFISILFVIANRNYLEKMIVSENGELEEPTKKQTREQSSSNFSKKLKLDVEKKICKEAPDTTQ